MQPENATSADCGGNLQDRPPKKGIGSILGGWFLDSFITWIIIALIGFMFWKAIIRMPILFLCLFGPLGLTMRYIRQRRAAPLLTHLAAAIELHHPLPEYLLAAAAGETRPTARRLRKLEALLSKGYTLSASVESVVPQTPPEVIEALRIAEHTGTIQREMPQILRRFSPWPVRHEMTFPVAIGQLWIVMGLLIFLTFAMPKYMKLTHSFRVAPPAITRWTANVGQYLMSLLSAEDFLFIQWTFFILLLALFMRMTFRSRSRRSRIRRWMVGLFAWYTPGFSWFARCRAWEIATASLAEAANCSMPLPEAFEFAAAAQPNSVARHVMRRCQRMIENGSPLRQALKKAGFSRGILELFPADADGLSVAGSAQTSGNSLVVLLQYANNWYAARYSAAVEWGKSLLLPVAVGLGGACVLLTMLAIWLPYVDILRKLSAGSNF